MLKAINDVLWGNLTQRVVLVVFVMLNGLLMLFSVPEGPYAAGGDIGVYIQPARELLNGNGFVHPDGQPYVWGPPLFPVFLAIFLGLLPWEVALYGIVTVQCVMLYAIGLMTSRLCGHVAPKASTLAQVLVIFNPNLLITAHLLQTEILFTFLMTAGVVVVFSFRASPHWAKVVYTGLLLGLATLTRPAGQFVIYILPVLFVLLGAWTDRETWSRLLPAGVLAAVVAILTVSPWVLRNHALFGTPFLTVNAGWYLEDQYRQLLHNGYGMSGLETKAAADDRVRERLPSFNLNTESMQNLPRISQSRILSGIYLDAMLEVPVSVHARVFIESLAELYIAGGASNIRNYLGIEGKQAIVQFQGESRSSLADAARRLFSRISYGYAVLLVIAFGYTLAMRTIGIVGLVSMFRKGMSSQVLAILAVMAVLTLSYLYLGQSRFRVPLEPYLAVMSAIGISAVRGKVDRK